MPEATKTRLRHRIRVVSLPVVILAGMYLAGTLGSSTASTTSSSPSKVGRLSPIVNTFEIALYTVTDPSENNPSNKELRTTELMQALNTEPLKSSVEPSGVNFQFTLKQCRKEQAFYDVVWVKEIDDEKTSEMKLELSVQGVSPQKQVHNHPDITKKPIGEACTYRPKWDTCREDKFKLIAKELASLDSADQNGRYADGK